MELSDIIYHLWYYADNYGKVIIYCPRIGASACEFLQFSWLSTRCVKVVENFVGMMPSHGYPLYINRWIALGRVGYFFGWLG